MIIFMWPIDACLDILARVSQSVEHQTMSDTSQTSARVVRILLIHDLPSLDLREVPEREEPSVAITTKNA
jgi:hypothetical protein